MINMGDILITVIITSLLISELSGISHKKLLKTYLSISVGSTLLFLANIYEEKLKFIIMKDGRNISSTFDMQLICRKFADKMS